MLPSFATPSLKFNIDGTYDTMLDGFDPHDCRRCGKSGGQMQAVYPVPASVSAMRPQGVRRSSEPIVSSHQPPYFPSGGANSSERVSHHPNRTSPIIENYSVKQVRFSAN
jgi:hypothetical protein